MPAAPPHSQSSAPERRTYCPRETDRALERLLARLPGDTNDFLARCEEVPNWAALMERAVWHGVAGVLQPYLTRVDSFLSPAMEAEAARRRAFERLGQLQLLATLEEAQGAFQAAAVIAVALNGPILGERLYPDPTAHLSADLDFLVAPAELNRARAALATIGFQEERGPSAACYRELSDQIRLYRPDAPRIELHFRGHTGFGTVFPAIPLLARARPYRTTRGLTVHVLAPEDEFLQLAVHAAGHCFGRLSWLYDLKLLTDRYQRLHWTTIAEWARSLQVTLALGYTCEVLRCRLGAAIPLGADLPPPRGLRRRAIDTLLGIVGDHPLDSRSALSAKLVFTALLCDRPSTTASLLRHELRWLTRRRGRPCEAPDVR
jgi:Uncharacterised nucleotidyltransferase